MAPSQGNIGRGHPQLPAKLGPVNHPAAHAIRTPEHPLHQVEVAVCQRLSNPRAAHPFAVDLKRLGVFDAETFSCAHPFKKVKVTRAVTAEPKVVADHQVADSQPVDQHLLHELLCRQATQPLIKLQTDHYVDTLFLECDQLLTKSRQPWWRLIPSKVFPGLRLKHHHHRRRSE